MCGIGTVRDEPLTARRADHTAGRRPAAKPSTGRAAGVIAR
jgi:hypothetical protein